jgi:hypothetical protein
MAKLPWELNQGDVVATVSLHGVTVITLALSAIVDLVTWLFGVVL